MAILLLLLVSIIGLALLAGAVIVVLALVIGAVKYTRNPKALIVDLKASVQKRL
jgi:hypothetical protein